MSHTLKKDESGNVVLDAEGNPVYVDEKGNEAGYNLPKLLAAVAATREERDTAQREKSELEARLKAFGKADPEEVSKALEMVANLDSKKLIEAGKIDEAVNEKLKPMREAWEKERAELKAAAEKADAKLASNVITAAFVGWKDADNWLVTRDLLEAKYGRRFEVAADGKLVPFKDDERTEKLYNKHGDIASFDEAMDHYLSEHPHRDKLRKGQQSKGADAPGAPRPGTQKPDPSNASLSPEERLARAREQGMGTN